MGIIGGLLLLPITGPVRGFRLLLESLREEAEAVLLDEGHAFAELIDLSMRHHAGQLSDADYAAQEAELLERLNSIREYRDELLHLEQEQALLYEEDEMDEEQALLYGDADVAEEEALHYADGDGDGGEW